MEKFGIKRKRTTNFSQADQSLLVELVAEKKHIIENTRTDGSTIAEKNEAWEYVMQRYNALSSNGTRTTKELKDKYHNLKQTLRKKKAENKKNIIGTGGGPFLINKLNDSEELLSSLLVEEGITGMSNIYDSDSAKNYENILDDVIVEEEIDTVDESDDIEIVSESEGKNSSLDIQKTSSKWQQYCPKDLRTKMNQKLQVMNSKNGNIEKQLKESQLILIKKQIELCDQQKLLCELKIKNLQRRAAN
ncbi:myb/SANT-like DNA-binding domain-containing protein 4 [Calliphora vicina]|uniref:myb/SANT-like DNA-binding domain-containing protein 4 n=1 Tax=Calliphora vicina TaxID=7373 RepID=UPI00325AAE45